MRMLRTKMDGKEVLHMEEDASVPLRTTVEVTETTGIRVVEEEEKKLVKEGAKQPSTCQPSTTSDPDAIRQTAEKLEHFY